MRVLTVISILMVSCGGSAPSHSTSTSVVTGVPAGTISISAGVTGVTSAGVTMTLAGPVTRSLTTDASGTVVFSGLPAGDYTLTPSSGDLFFSPPAVTFIGTDAENFVSPYVFVAMPHSVAPTITVSGDAASGVAGGTYTALSEPAVGTLQVGTTTNPDVLIYSGGVWYLSLRMFFNPGVAGLGGYIGFANAPQVQSYGLTSAGFQALNMICWQETAHAPLPGQTDEYATWIANDFNLTLSSVTPANEPGIAFYSVHGTLHVDCPAYPGTAQHPLPSTGNVSLDVTF